MKKDNQRKDAVSAKQRSKAARIIGFILFVSLVLSVVYSFIRFCMAPAEPLDDQMYEKVKADYLLMFVQCLLGTVVMMLPSVLAKRFQVVVPNAIVILYFVFLYCAIYLGEMHNFYYVVPHWDTILHAFSGAMLGALGFILVNLLNQDQHIRVSLSPFFVAVFAFCFALTVGALWEIYEFSFDALLGLNMQKHTTEAGVALVGTKALADTMKAVSYTHLTLPTMAVV